MLGKAADYDRINWLMLMMVDPQVHFHVLPRYDGARSHGDLTVGDAGWPGPPDLKSAVTLSDEARADLGRMARGPLAGNRLSLSANLRSASPPRRRR